MSASLCEDDVEDRLMGTVGRPKGPEAEAGAMSGPAAGDISRAVRSLREAEGTSLMARSNLLSKDAGGPRLGSDEDPRIQGV